MRTALTSIAARGLALITMSTFSLAQQAAPATPQAVVYDSQQFPAIRGQLDRLTLTARGDIDGFVLKDGTEVKTAPNLSTQIAFAIKPGDTVTVYGLKAAALPLVRAISITDEASHSTVTDSGVAPMNPPAPPRRGSPPEPLGATSETSGRVRMVLHGPQGEVNGVLLESGAILRFPPDRGARLTALIQPRHSVVAEGPAITNALGTVVDVRKIGSSRNQLVAIGAHSPSFDDRGPAWSRRRAVPPTDGAPQPPRPPPAGVAAGSAAASPPAPPAS